MNMQNIDILELLPQRRPFVIIDRLLHYDSVVTKTEFTVTEDNIFVKDGVLSEAGMMENIAQTCAARMGYMNLVSNEPVKVGFIGAIKGMEIYSQPKINDRVETTIEVISEVMTLTLVRAKMELKGEILVKCEMKIAISDL